MSALAHFYGWTFAEIRDMTMRDVNAAMEYRNRYIESNK